MIPTLELPPSLPVPSCERWRTLFLAKMEPEFVAEQLRQTFQKSLRVRVKTALCSLKQFVSWRQLEVIPDSMWVPKSQVADALERRRMRGEAHRHAEICARTDLVALIGQYVTLVSEGKNFVGPCPFHDDKEDSLKVSSEGRFYCCFGCHASGDAVRFLMAKEQTYFPTWRSEPD